jgi:Icc-related predicted phosphoesterase
LPSCTAKSRRNDGASATTMRLRKKTERNGAKGSRLFFATDIHGSDRCFRKFINAGKFYDARYLIVGGDILGKSLVTIDPDEGGWRATYHDHDHRGLSEAGRQELEQYIRDRGDYPVVAERAERARMGEEEREAVFKEVVIESIARWVTFAEERLRGTGIRCFITPGNDDYWEIDDVLMQSGVVEFVEGRCVQLDGSHEMITTGYTNPTPWDTPRELEEGALAERIEAMAREVKDPSNLIAVLHAPPYGTDLDQAPQLTEALSMKLEGGAPKIGPVGSKAVRDFIANRQPLLALHGHVHESRAVQEIGRTVCVNAGSVYSEGVLYGALITLGNGRLETLQLVAG